MKGSETSISLKNSKSQKFLVKNCIASEYKGKRLSQISTPRALSTRDYN